MKYTSPPIKVDNTGTKHWDPEGKLHREGGLPAFVGNNGDLSWCIHGEFHRLEGPAIDHHDFKGWYIDGISYTEKEHAFKAGLILNGLEELL